MFKFFVKFLEKLIVKKYLHKIKDSKSKQKAVLNISKLGCSFEEIYSAFSNFNFNF